MRAEAAAELARIANPDIDERRPAAPPKPVRSPVPRPAPQKSPEQRRREEQARAKEEAKRRAEEAKRKAEQERREAERKAEEERAAEARAREEAKRAEAIERQRAEEAQKRAKEEAKRQAESERRETARKREEAKRKAEEERHEAARKREEERLAKARAREEAKRADAEARRQAQARARAEAEPRARAEAEALQAAVATEAMAEPVEDQHTTVEPATAVETPAAGSRKDRRSTRRLARRARRLGLVEDEEITLSVEGDSRYRRSTLLITSFRVAVVPHGRRGRVRWIPLEEITDIKVKRSKIIVHAPVEVLRFTAHLKRLIQGPAEILRGEVRVARRGMRRSSEVVQLWCDMTSDIWDSNAGQLRLFLRRHPVPVVGVLAPIVPVAYLISRQLFS